MVEQHQREQPARLRLVGRERQLTGQPDRLPGQVHPARVAGRVDQVQHAEHHGKVAGLVQPTPVQGSLGPADPLRHRRLRHVERVGDLPGREAADGAQGQRHLRRRREVGVAAAEQQEAGCRHPPRSARRSGVRHTSPPARRRRAASLRRASTSRRVATVGQPRPRVARRMLGPYPQRLEQRLLQASSAASKSSPRRTRPASTRGTRRAARPRPALASTVDHAGQPAAIRSSSRERRSTRTCGVPPGPGSDET